MAADETDNFADNEVARPIECARHGQIDKEADSIGKSLALDRTKFLARRNCANLFSHGCFRCVCTTQIAAVLLQKC